MSARIAADPLPIAPAVCHRIDHKKAPPVRGSSLARTTWEVRSWPVLAAPAAVSAAPAPRLRSQSRSRSSAGTTVLGGSEPKRFGEFDRRHTRGPHLVWTGHRPRSLPGVVRWCPAQSSARDVGSAPVLSASPRMVGAQESASVRSCHPQQSCGAVRQIPHRIEEARPHPRGSRTGDDAEGGPAARIYTNL